MDQFVKKSIEGRKMAFTNSYIIKDKGLLDEIEKLFVKINELGEKCSDCMDFETKFANSPLNIEYTNLFTKIATSCKQVIYDTKPNDTKSDEEYLKDEIKSDVKYAVNDLSMPVRRKVRETFDSKMRDTPLGEIEQIKNTTSLFGRIFKK